jgi:hypothetical protein
MLLQPQLIIATANPYSRSKNGGEGHERGLRDLPSAHKRIKLAKRGLGIESRTRAGM